MDSMGLLAQMGIKVALGVLLAVVAAALARRFHRMGNGGRAQTGSLQVAETAALGQNRALHLVRVGRRALLIGSTPSAISLLADVTVDRGPFSKEPEVEPPCQASPRQAFAAVLSRLVAPSRGPAPRGPAPRGRAERLRTAAQALRTTPARSGRS